MREALRDIIITGRRQRLQARAQVPTAKAAPAGLRVPNHHKPLNELTLQELRAKARYEEERAVRSRGVQVTSWRRKNKKKKTEESDYVHKNYKFNIKKRNTDEQYKNQDDLQQNRQKERNKHEIKKNLTDRQRIQTFQQN
eukprot:5128866-Amphidinium_carterae.1